MKGDLKASLAPGTLGLQLAGLKQWRTVAVHRRLLPDSQRRPLENGSLPMSDLEGLNWGHRCLQRVEHEPETTSRRKSGASEVQRGVSLWNLSFLGLPLKAYDPPQ
ncbi:hypothetical protein NDU88_005626 [Pleurodeles waltl]|uniref:Uncharacterized protein n=1 Tax=Pleurodeles waltl TaxID=8319 RepID=A0AAV7LLZ4_PLEWA|nr:hypothetical protein NDU88_005626 [Pleurodeles waltl]